MTQETDIVATINPSPARRGLAVAMLVVLGALLVYIAFATPPASPVWRIFLVGIGLTALIMAQKVFKATTVGLVLTKDSLRDTEGRLLCNLADVERVERGAFAFKPSNGCLITTRSRGPRAWAPGLWWRLGRRIGIGGVTSASEVRLVAELIDMRLKGRDFPGF